MGLQGLQAVLRAEWAPRGIQELGSDGIRTLQNFKQDYQGMGRANGEREREAKAAIDPSITPISMGGGLPDHALLPFDSLVSHARAAWEAYRPAPLEYGSTVGESVLKEQICKYLSRRRSGHVYKQDELFITTGNQGGIDAIARAYLGPADTAIVESPLWTSTLNIVKSTGADVCVVGQDNDGILIEAVEDAINSAIRAARRPKIIYTQPLHHNPTGSSISANRAEALLCLAAQHGCIVVCDEAYEAFEYETRDKFCHLSTMSAGYGVLTVHTFSKTLGTGLRLGYVHGASNLVEPLMLGRVTQASVMLEYTVAELLRSGLYDRLTAQARSSYLRKRDVFCQELVRHMQSFLRKPFTKPRGGFFVWLPLAPHCRFTAEEHHLELLRRGVLCGLGEHYFGPGMHDDGYQGQCSKAGCEQSRGHIRLAFIGCTEQELVDAARRIGAACIAVANAAETLVIPETTCRL